MPQQTGWRFYVYVALQLLISGLMEGEAPNALLRSSVSLSHCPSLMTSLLELCWNFAGTWRPAAIGWLLTKALSSAVVIY